MRVLFVIIVLAMVLSFIYACTNIIGDGNVVSEADNRVDKSSPALINVETNNESESNDRRKYATETKP